MYVFFAFFMYRNIQNAKQVFVPQRVKMVDPYYRVLIIYC